MKKIISALLIIILLLSTGCIGFPGDDGPCCGGDDRRIVNLFIAVHHEPGMNTSNTIYQEKYWPALTQMITSADNYSHKLTLLFNPQWVTYILEDPARLDLVRTWEEHGHELGLHSHGPSRNAWNGYTNQQNFTNHSKYIGTIDEMMVLMNKLPISGEIKVAAVTDQDSEYDYPSGISYDVDGGAEGVDHLVSKTYPVTLGGNTMTGLFHAKFGEIGGIDVNFEDIHNAIDTVDDDEIIGLVFHTFEYAEKPYVFNNLFDFLDNQGVRVRTVSEIIE